MNKIDHKQVLNLPLLSTSKYQTRAKNNQESMKEAAKPSSVHDHGKSIIEMKKSFRYLNKFKGHGGQAF